MALATKKRKKTTAPRRVKSGFAAIDTARGFRKFQQIAHIYVDNKEYAPIIKTYIRKKFDKKTAQSILSNPDYKFVSSNIASYCYYSQLENVDPVPEETVDWINTRFANLVESGKNVVVEKVKVEKVKAQVYKPSIQERMAEQLENIIAEIESWVDEQPSSTVPKLFDYLKSNNVAQAHINKIRSFYEPVAAEYQALTEKDCPEDLKEGYSHYSKAEIKQIIKFYESLFSDLDAYANLKRVSRATRKPRLKSADKQVAKLKLKKDDARYKIVSLDPIQIIGASELWIFNVKTRKLGKYVAQNIDPTGLAREGSGFSVKGTTLVGFNEEESVQKTLRKPEEQLKEFMGSGKVALRKFLENIKATETKMNGRFNEHTVLLKVS